MRIHIIFRIWVKTDDLQSRWCEFFVEHYGACTPTLLSLPCPPANDCPLVVYPASFSYSFHDKIKQHEFHLFHNMFVIFLLYKGVLTCLTRPEVMNILWTENYSRCHVDQSAIEFPLVLDPANPTNNVAKFYGPHIWQQLKAAANEALQETIFKR